MGYRCVGIAIIGVLVYNIGMVNLVWFTHRR